MWVYCEIGSRWVVDYFMPDKEWFADSDYETKEDAAARVNYLNGGTGE